MFMVGGGEIIEISKKTESQEQVPSSRMANARTTSVYVSGNDVYVVGYQHSEESKTVAKLWKNGIEQDISDGSSHAFALSVFVSGNDVYVAGYEHSGSTFEIAPNKVLPSCVAVLWKNGVAQKLSNKKTKYAIASSVFVSGNDVYVASTESYPNKQDTFFSVAKLWKNGVVQNLSGGCSSGARSVFVSGNDVYVAGTTSPSNSNSSIAVLWKNGVAQNLGNETKMSFAYSGYISGDDIYVAGVEYQPHGNKRTPVLWKNGNAQYMELGGIISNIGCNDVTGSANSICVSDSGDVYATGFVECNRGIFSVLWKNGIAQKLNQDGTFQMVEELIRYNSVFVSGEDVYVTGSVDGVRNAAIWKNGILQELTDNPPIDYDKIIIR